MRMKILFSFLAIAGVAALIQACGSSSTTSTTTVSCTAEGVFSTTAFAAGQEITVTNLEVFPSGGTAPYTITLPNGQSVSGQTTEYEFTTTETLEATGTDTLGSVTITDSASPANTGTCLIESSTGTTSATSTSYAQGSLTVSASPGISGLSIGQTVTLTATDPGLASPTYTFTLVSGTTTGVTLTTTSTTGTGIATVTSSIATTVSVEVVAVDSAGNGNQLIGTLTWGSGTTGTGSLICALSAQVYGQEAIFNITTNTGEPLEITYFYPGESWDAGAGPTYPIYLYQGGSLPVNYDTPGYKSVEIIASGIYSGLCNGTGILTTTVDIP